MMEPDAAAPEIGAADRANPQLVRRLRAGLVTPHSGGAGAPPGGTRAAREELADGGRLGRPSAATRKARQELSRKRGPAPKKRRHGAPRGARVLRQRAHGKTEDWLRLAALHPLGLSEGAGREDGVPGAAKEYGRRSVG